MSSTYGFFRQTHLPTSIDYCLSANFTHSEQVNLIVVKSTILEVYVLVENFSSNGKITTKLVLHGQYRLYGDIRAICKGKYTGNVRDSLLITFKNAKLSVLDFDPSLNDLVTSSMHSFEDQLNSTGKMVFNFEPLLAADPLDRCAAMQISENRLMILPLVKQNLAFLKGQAKLARNRRKTENKDRTFYFIDLDLIPLAHIIDMAFLHGYDEPSLLILHSPKRTWAGRAEVNQFSGEITTLSLNLSQKTYSVFCKIDEIPYDSKRVVPVPLPVGGAIIFGGSTILHAGQTLDFGLSLNEFGVLQNSEDVTLEDSKMITNLDLCQSAFLTPKRLMIASKDGELFLLTLDESRRMDLVKVGASVLPTQMCTVTPELIFLGSRVGDSLLVRFVAKPKKNPRSEKLENGEKDEADSERASKKAKTTESDPAANDSIFGITPQPPARNAVPLIPGLSSSEGSGASAFGGHAIETEFFEVFGESKHTDEEKEPGVDSTQLYNFSVIDSLNSVSPIVDYQIGPSNMQSADDSKDDSKDQTDMLEIVACTGHGKNGCISIIQEGVRPEVITDLSLQREILGCWTLFEDQDEEEDESSSDSDVEDVTPKEEPLHSYLLISQIDSTLVLSTQESLQQVTHTDFHVKGPTICCGHVLNRTRTIQVYENGVMLLKKGAMQQDLPAEHSIVEASISDPYIVVRLSDESVRFIATSQENDRVVCNMTQPKLTDLEEAGGVTAICVYKDPGKSGAFTVKTPSQTDLLPSETVDITADDPDNNTVEFLAALESESSEPLLTPAPKKEELESEDAAIAKMLFGGEEKIPGATTETTMSDLEDDDDMEDDEDDDEDRSEYVCVLTRNNGRLEMYSLPSFTRVFSAPNFASGQKLLHNSLCHGKTDEFESVADVRCEEICMTQLGPDTKPFLLSFLTNGDLLVYELFCYDPRRRATKDQYIPLRLSKVRHRLITRPLMAETSGQDEEETTWKGGKRFVPFLNIASRSGVFIGGRRPAWVFGERGFFRLHPMTTLMGVSSLTPFHNVNCQNGLVFFDMSGVLNIAALPDPSTACYDSEMPLKKVALKRTAHQITRHAATNTYVVVVSRPAETLPLEMPTDRSLKTMTDKYSVQCYASDTWKMTSEIDDFNEFENILCICEATLIEKRDADSTGPPVNFICIGTGNQQGEDVQCRGKIHLIQVETKTETKVARGGDTTITKSFLLKRIYDREERGPITAMSPIEGLLCMCIGPKILLFYWDGKHLVGCAFFDAQFYAVSCATLKNFILVGDVYKSVYLLLWESDTKQLVLLGKDFHRVPTYACEFVIDNGDLNLLVSDSNKNIQLLNYAPHRAESRGGTRLLRRADFHTAEYVGGFVKLKARSIGNINREQRYVMHAGTYAGGMFYVSPIDEQIFRRLFTLHTQMTYNVEHYGGLNPRAFRLFKCFDKNHVVNKKNMVDGELLSDYMHLDALRQKKFARMIGTTPEQIIDNLLHIDLCTRLF